MALLMGIDLGTSSLKALIMDEDGHVRAQASIEYSISSPHGGWSEQDPEIWWDACTRAVRRCLASQSIDKGEIKAVSFSGQMHGAVLLDRDLNPVRKVILHNDARSTSQVKELNEIFGARGVRDMMMNPVYTGFLLPSLLWVRENEPKNYEKTTCVCLPKDYLKLRMVGEVSSDYSDASATLAYDIRKNVWSGDILSKVKVPESIFPKLYGTTEAVGTVSPVASSETGLAESTVVVAGGGDQVMQGIGNGVIGQGIASSNIGTSGQLSFRSDRPVLNPDLTTNTFSSFRKGQWLTMGAIMNAGIALKWWNSLFGQADYEKVERMVSGVKQGSGGLIFLPYLNGERTPHLNPNISGMFLGVNLHTGRDEMTRAVMEGVTYALNQCGEICEDLGLKASVVIASGGGARSATWLKIQSDVFNKPVKVTKMSEQASLGAAIASGVGCGVYGSIEEGCSRAIRYKDEVIEPNRESHKIYEEYYSLFKEAYQSSKKVLEETTLLGRRTLG